MIHPIYRSDGECVAVYYAGNVFNMDREWIGYVSGRDVFTPQGKYLAYLSDDRRLVRARTVADAPRPKTPPPSPRPSCPKLPSAFPLAPLMGGLPYHLIDMFETYPEQLIYVSETRPDMD